MRISDWSSDVCSSDLVNRVPVDGTITALAYRPGKFVNAAFDKASEEHERMALKVTSYDGVDVGFVQIAGLVARRLVCNVQLDDPVRDDQSGKPSWRDRDSQYVEITVVGDTIKKKHNNEPQQQ